MKALIYFFLVIIVPSLASAQFQGLYGEIHGSSEAGTTYRLYAEFDSPGNEVNAVFHLGSQEQLGDMSGPIPIELSVSTEFFQHSLGVDFGSEINLTFYSIFPQLEYDSWLTIGSTSSADADVNTVGMSSPLEDFNAGNGFFAEANIGGSWYVHPGENELAVSGEDGLVLLGQFTVLDDSLGGQGDFAITLSLQWEDIEGNAWLEFSTSFNSINLQVGIIGCTDNSACNFDSLAVIESGECEYTDICGVCGGGGVPEGTCDCSGIAPELGFDCDGNCLSDANQNGICDFVELESIQSAIDAGQYCGEGTVWDYSLQQCVVNPSVCGEGTTWNYTLGQCLPLDLCPADVDDDGVVGVADLLGILSAFGLPCEPAAAVWNCGDPISYHGYDYETVLIGEQCWFAENLRNEHYANGDAIPGDLSNSEWESTTEGAQAILNNDTSNLADFGRLYNWYAVDDERGLCPTGWHVPTDEQFMTLEIALGMSESEASSGNDWRGTDQGTQLKTSFGWANGGNGTNASGFSALPAEYRSSGGSFFCCLSGAGASFWTSSTLFPDNPNAWFRSLNHANSEIYRAYNNKRSGYSVRCLKDANP